MARAYKRGRTALRPPKSKSTGVSYVLLVVLLLLLAGAIYVAVQAYYRVRDIGTILDRPFATPVPVTGSPAPTPDPLEPMNILLLGIDRREGESGTRNDVNIVVHIDPVHRYATMLSIPRDTRVQIPGHYATKINAAYYLGEAYHADTGGGPVLAKRTVEGFLGVPIHYYAEVDFYGMQRIVDLLKGITVDVPFPLLDNEYPTEDYGYTRIYIPAGLQHMDGRTALQYARSRHGDPHSDFGRNQRQQQILMALRKRALNLDLLADLVFGSEAANQLLSEFGDTFGTDMPKSTLFSLARLASRIDPDNIESYALDWHCLSDDPDPNSYDLIPSMACVYDLVDKMQNNPTERKLDEESARVYVLNGTIRPGLAGRTHDYLKRQGFTVVGVGNADTDTYTRTLVLDNADHTFTRELLVELLGADPDGVELELSYTPDADIVIILGEDFVEPQE